MREVLLVGLGGAIGATARYGVYLLIARWSATGFPLATLVVNALGSLLMGLLIELLAQVWDGNEHLRLLLGVGILGAFTTFSTFSLDTVILYERGELLQVFVYITASLIFSIGALLLGVHVLRQLLTLRQLLAG